MRKNKKTICLVSLAMVIMILLIPGAPMSQAAYAPPVTTLRIGLYYNTTALPSANLQNVSGFGSGFEFGYYDGNRNFVPIGAWTDESTISMVMDRNMTWYPGAGGGAGEYREGEDGSVVLGCFHIMLDLFYETFDQAKEAAEPYNDSYVKYDSGYFYVMTGQYTTRAEAENAITSRGISGALVNAGTSNTIAIVKTGTNQMIFEFDYGATRYLGVRPKQTNDENPEAFFLNNRYNGGFQYSRRDGALLTIIHYVDIEDYVKGIIPYEMNNTWPIEALKAQACCARTYAIASLNKHSASGFDLCTTEDCQVYRGRGDANERTDLAVEETAGLYVTYDGELCTTFYAASNGGASENSENVWSETIPYLIGVVDPYEADVALMIPNYYWTITYTQQQITQRLKNSGINCSTIVSMKVSAYTVTGNVLTVTMKDDRGLEYTFSKRDRLYTALGVPTQHFNIGSATYEPGSIFVNDSFQTISPDSRFFAIDGNGITVPVPGGQMYAITESGSIEIVRGETVGDSGDDNGMINGVFTIKGSGRGHNVGMSQWGAYSMAEYHGKTFLDIIEFYFSGVEVG